MNISKIDTTKNFVSFFYIKDCYHIDRNTLLTLESMKFYLNIFNGQRIIYVANDNITESFKDEVNSIFNFIPNKEIYFVENHPHFRESFHLVDSINKIQDLQSITFYFHNKGSTHPYGLDGLSTWILSMFYFNLSEKYIEVTQNKLDNEFFFSGIYKKVFNWESVNWHYSGAFFWFQTKKVVETPNWDIVNLGRFGLESHPGKICNSDLSWSNLYTEFGDFEMSQRKFDEIITAENVGESEYEKFKSFCNYITSNTQKYI